MICILRFSAEVCNATDPHRTGRLTMPLITVKRSQSYIYPIFKDADGHTPAQHVFDLLRSYLPEVFTDHWQKFGINEAVHATDVQVCFDTFGLYDINTPSLWIKVELSEVPAEDEEERVRIRDAIYSEIVNIFLRRDYLFPGSFAFDLSWGPTHGVCTILGHHGDR